MTNYFRALLLPVLCLTLGQGVTYAQTSTWTGTATSAWSTGTNWSGGVAPTAGGSSTAVLNFGGALTSAVTATNDLTGTYTLTTLNITHTGAFNMILGGNQLNFAGTANTLNFSGAQSSGGDTINNAINFTNGLTVSVGNFNQGNLTNTLSGSGGLIINGNNSTLKLSHANTYFGGTQINGKEVIIGSATSFGDVSGAVEFNTGTLDTAGAITLAYTMQIGGNVIIYDTNNTSGNSHPLTLSGTVDLQGANRTISVGSTVGAGITLNVFTITGTLTDGAVTKGGQGVMKLSGADTYTGGTTITNGILQFGSDAAIPSIALSGTNSILVTAGGVLAVNASSVTTLNTVNGWLADGRLSNASGGTIALNGTAASVDMTTGAGYGSLFLGAFANTTLTSANTITPFGSTYRLGGGGANLTLSGTNALTDSGGARNLIVGPVLTQATVGGATITAAQTSAGGTVTLSSSNNMSGTTTVNSILLNLSGAGSLANSDVTLAPGSTMSINPTGTLTTTRVKSLTFNKGTLTVTGTSIAGTSTEAITGSLTLNSGFNTINITPSATGNETLTAGALTRTSGQGWALVSGVNLGMDSTTTSNVGKIKFTTAPTLVGTTTALSTGINAAAQNTQIVPWLVGTVGTASGTSTSTLSGTANTFMTYNASTGLRPLNLTSEFTNNAIVAGNNIFLNQATSGTTTASINSLVTTVVGTATVGNLAISNGVTITDVSGALLFVGNSTISATGTGKFDFGSAEGIVTVDSSVTGSISAAITGTSGISKFGAGTLTLNGTSSYTGGNRINSGVLTTNLITNGGVNSGIGADTNAASNLVLDGGTLNYSSAVAATSDRLFSVGTYNGGISVTGTGALSLTNTGAMGFNGESGARTVTFGGSVTGNLVAALIGDNGGATSVIKNGNGGSWTLSNANTYTGATTIQGDSNNNGGILIATTLADGGSASSIGASTNDASNLQINRGTLQFVGGTTSTNRLFTAGALGATIDSSGTGALTFTNTGSIALAGTSQRALTLTGTNTGNNIFMPSVADSSPNAAAGSTSLVKSGTGTWLLGGLNTFSGSTTISAGNLGLTGTGVLGGGSYAGAIANSGTFTFGSSASQTLSGVISGSGTLVLNSTGSLNLSGSNTYSGATVITAGDLSVTGSGVLGNGSYSSTISNSGTFTYSSAASQILSGVISGTGTLVQNGTGPLTLSGTNTYSGPTIVSSGTLVVAKSTTVGGGTITNGAVGKGTLALSGGELDDNGTAISLANSVTLNGTITLGSTGSGSLNFNGTTLTAPATVTLLGDTSLIVNNTTTIADGLSGNFTLTKLGSGNLNLTGTSTSTAGTTITSGSITLANGNSLGSGLISLANGTKLTYTGGAGTLNQNITVASAATGTVSNTGTATLTLAGTLTKADANLILNAGGHTIDVTGAIVSTGATGTFDSDLYATNGTIIADNSNNSYSGPTHIYGNGTLVNGFNNALPTSTVVELGNSGGPATETGAAYTNIYQLNGHNQSIAGLTSTNPAGFTDSNHVIGGSATLSTLTLTGTASLGEGILGGTGTNANNLAVKFNPGSGKTITLSGSNTYTGGTEVVDGNLLVNNTTGSATGGGTFKLDSGAGLSGTGTITSTSNTVNGNVTVGSGGTNTTDVLTMTASGTTTFSGANLTFNLDANSTNSNVMALGSTPSIYFGSGVTTLTLNLLGTGSTNIANGTDYILFTASSASDYKDLTFSGSKITNFVLTLTGTASNGAANSLYYGQSYLILSGNNIEIQVVPEPGTWALMLGGLAALMFWQRKTRRQ